MSDKWIPISTSGSDDPLASLKCPVCRCIAWRVNEAGERYCLWCVCLAEARGEES